MSTNLNQQHTRRTFLKNSAKACAILGFPTIIPASVLGRSGAVAPSNRVSLAHIGCGMMARGLRNTFCHMPDVQIVACADVERSRLQDFKHFYDSFYQKERGQGQALADFNSAASAEALLGQCKAGQTADIKDAAIIGYAHLMAQDQRVAPSVKLAALGGLLDLAETSSQRITILNTLAGVADPGVETLANAYLGSADSAVVEAANAAILGSQEMLNKGPRKR